MTIKSISAGDFVQLEVPPRQNIISPFLPERGLAEIYAKTGVGKTTFALSLAIAASTGKHFFEWEVRRPWKVLYIDGEMSTHEMQKRLTSAAEYFSEDPTQLSNLRLICRDREDAGLPDIGSEKGQDWFSEDIEQAELVFLDNISCLWWSGKENDADAWSVIQHWLLRLRAARKSVVLLHHSGKNGSSRGSSRRHDVLDTVIKLERPFNYIQQDGAKFEVHFDKNRTFAGNDAAPVGLANSPNSGWQTFNVGLEKAEQVASLTLQGMKQTDIAEKLRISQAEVSRRKGQAASAGLL